MKVELARRLNLALSGVDTAKTELAAACNTGSDESIEAAADRYMNARAEMGLTMELEAIVAEEVERVGKGDSVG